MDRNVELMAQRIRSGIQPEEVSVRRFAVAAVADSPGGYNVGQICRLWNTVNKDFRYVSDVRGFDFGYSASETIRAGLAGDCDDCAILTASLIEAIGGTGRVVLAMAVGPGHAYAEVYMGKEDYLAQRAVPVIQNYFPSIRHIYCHQDTVGGCWMNMDVLGPNNPGGAFFESHTDYATYRDGYSEMLCTVR